MVGNELHSNQMTGDFSLVNFTRWLPTSTNVWDFLTDIDTYLQLTLYYEDVLNAPATAVHMYQYSARKYDYHTVEKFCEFIISKFSQFGGKICKIFPSWNVLPLTGQSWYLKQNFLSQNHWHWTKSQHFLQEKFPSIRYILSLKICCDIL